MSKGDGIDSKLTDDGDADVSFVCAVDVVDSQPIDGRVVAHCTAACQLTGAP